MISVSSATSAERPIGTAGEPQKHHNHHLTFGKRPEPQSQQASNALFKEASANEYSQLAVDKQPRQLLHLPTEPFPSSAAASHNQLLEKQTRFLISAGGLKVSSGEVKRVGGIAAGPVVEPCLSGGIFKHTRKSQGNPGLPIHQGGKLTTGSLATNGIVAGVRGHNVHQTANILNSNIDQAKKSQRYGKLYINQHKLRDAPKNP